MVNQKIPIGKVLVLGLFVLGVSCFFYFDLGQYLTLVAIKESKDSLKIFTESHYDQAVILYVVVYALQTALSLPGGAILTLVGGFLFGSLFGTLYVNIGATAGATLAFLSARYLFRDLIEKKMGKRLESLQAGFSENSFYYLLTLRLIPLFPFFLVNLASGLTRIPIGTYVLGTALGIIPGSFVFSHAGSQLGTINTLKDIASPQVLGAFVLLGLLSLVPVAYRKFKTVSSIQG
ncbi:MAG: TVP38/TMEM64 family protein [Nitrospirota bacterium]